MHVTSLTQTRANMVSAEYSIYAYIKYCKNTIDHNKWRCVGQMDDADQALEAAQKLFYSAQFQKIEVKKKFFNSKKKRHYVATLRTFESKSKINFWIFGVLVVLTIAPVVFILLEKL